jgi:hypothetical protein
VRTTDVPQRVSAVIQCSAGLIIVHQAPKPHCVERCTFATQERYFACKNTHLRFGQTCSMTRWYEKNIQYTPCILRCINLASTFLLNEEIGSTFAFESPQISAQREKEQNRTAVTSRARAGLRGPLSDFDADHAHRTENTARCRCQPLLRVNRVNIKRWYRRF